MKGAWSYIIAGAVLSGVLIAGITAAQGRGITLIRNGDNITITGFTNLAPGNRMLVNVVSAGFTPTEKGTGGSFTGAGGTVVVRESSPMNTYSFDVNISTFPPGVYLVSVESIETGVTESAQFVLPWTAVPTGIPSTPATTPATISTPPAPDLITVPATQASPTEVPIPWIVSIGALALATCVLRR